MVDVTRDAKLGGRSRSANPPVGKTPGADSGREARNSASDRRAHGIAASALADEDAAGSSMDDGDGDQVGYFIDEDSPAGPSGQRERSAQLGRADEPSPQVQAHDSLEGARVMHLMRTAALANLSNPSESSGSVADARKRGSGGGSDLDDGRDGQVLHALMPRIESIMRAMDKINRRVEELGTIIEKVNKPGEPTPSFSPSVVSVPRVSDAPASSAEHAKQQEDGDENFLFMLSGRHRRPGPAEGRARPRARTNRRHDGLRVGKCTCQKKSSRSMPVLCPNYRYTMFHPNTTFLEALERLLVLAVLYVAISVPLYASFTIPNENAAQFFEVGLDAVFICDFFIQTRTGFREKASGRLIMEPVEVWHMLLSKWEFYVDVVACLPYEIIALVLIQSTDAGRYLGAIRLIRLTKLSRMVHLFKLMSRLEEHLEVSHALIRMLNYFIGLVFAIHIVACAWWSLANHGTFALADADGDFRHEWLPDTVLQDMPFELQYSHACWFATRALLFGQENWPRSAVHIWFSILVQLLGVFMVSFIIGSVGGLVAELDQESLAIRHRIETVMRFLRANHITEELREKVQAFLWYKHKHDSGNDRSKLAAVRAELSGALAQELDIQFWSRFLDLFTWFFSTRRIPDSVAVDLLPMLTDYYFYQDELVYPLGQPAGENPTMCFIMDGSLELVQQNKPSVPIGIGMVFGEDCFFGRASRRQEQVRTTTPCKVFMLERRKYDSVVRHHDSQSGDLGAILDPILMNAPTPGVSECLTAKMRNSPAHQHHHRRRRSGWNEDILVGSDAEMGGRLSGKLAQGNDGAPWGMDDVIAVHEVDDESKDEDADAGVPLAPLSSTTATRSPGPVYTSAQEAEVELETLRDFTKAAGFYDSVRDDDESTVDGESEQDLLVGDAGGAAAGESD